LNFRPVLPSYSYERPQEKQALKAKLARCCELAKEFPHGSTAQMIRDMEEEFRQQIRELEK
jgi:hypothetical protein